MSPSVSKVTTDSASHSGRAAPVRFREGWLHLCNGLDPVRDGGMVPSILGMTGALAEHATPVTIVTPTPSRLGTMPLPPRVNLRGPETDLEAVVRSAEVVHMHGLWQAHTRRGARAARVAAVPYMIAAHGMAEPWAMRHKAWKKKLYTAFVEGKTARFKAAVSGAPAFYGYPVAEPWHGFDARRRTVAFIQKAFDAVQ